VTDNGLRKQGHEVELGAMDGVDEVSLFFYSSLLRYELPVYSLTFLSLSYHRLSFFLSTDHYYFSSVFLRVYFFLLSLGVLIIELR